MTNGAAPQQVQPFKAGLEDVIVSTSEICFIDGHKGRLLYRGYDVDDLVAQSTFEEVVYLLWHGHLPSRKELDVQALKEEHVPLAQGTGRVSLVRALAHVGLVASTSEGRRLLAQGAVRVDNARVTDLKAELGPGTYLVQVGKLRAVRLRVG